MLRRASLPILGLAILALAGCVFVATDEGDHRHRNKDDHKSGLDHDGDHDGEAAHAILEPKSGSSLSGYASFRAMDGGVLVEVRVQNAGPGLHAAHIHEVGDCSAPDGTSAGGHFNPAGVMHGAPHAAERHAGDLGNMWVDEHGNGTHILFMPGLSLDQGPMAIRGRALIVHADADDLVSQPTGAAGGRIACGVIR